MFCWLYLFNCVIDWSEIEKWLVHSEIINCWVQFQFEKQPICWIYNKIWYTKQCTLNRYNGILIQKKHCFVLKEKTMVFIKNKNYKSMVLKNFIFFHRKKSNHACVFVFSMKYFNRKQKPSKRHTLRLHLFSLCCFVVCSAGKEL